LGEIGPTSLPRSWNTGSNQTLGQRLYAVPDLGLGLRAGLEVTPQEGTDEASAIHPYGHMPLNEKGDVLRASHFSNTRMVDNTYYWDLNKHLNLLGG